MKAIVNINAKVTLMIVAGAFLHCASNRDIDARLYDSAGMCLGPPLTVGQLPVDRSCPPASRYAVDKDGRCFWFRDLCIPAGFTVADEADTRCPIPKVPAPDCP
jgi:hypothetical protein